MDSPGPVYLDLEKGQQEDLARRMGVARDAVPGELAAAVRNVLDLTRGKSRVLKDLTDALRRWGAPGRQDPPPPVLGFLAALCMAAENMAAGEGVASTNFYFRLAELLKLEKRESKLLEEAYRQVGETYWRAVDHWLVHHHGERGLSTIVAAKPRYVGYPIGQALIRATDRDRLLSFFEDSGLPPGALIDPVQLMVPLEEWIERQPTPATKNLARIWATGREARRTVAESAVAALATWDGQVAKADGEHHAGGRLALQASIGTFPKKRLGLSVLAYLPEADQPRSARVIAANGPCDLDLTPSIPGALAMAESSAIDIVGLLEGRLTIEDPMTGKSITRQPRRLVAFRHDEATGRWIETPRVMLTQDLLLFCYNAMLPKVTEILDATARPGWHRLADDFPKKPERWTVIRDVQIFRSPGKMVPAGLSDLQVLVPLATTQLSISGGFRLPVRMRNVWHVAEPPEIRAVTDSPEAMRLVLRDRTALEAWDDEAQVVDEWSDDGSGALVVSLLDEDLEVGDYELSLYAAQTDVPVAVSAFHLRDGDAVDKAQWEAVIPVPYSVGGALGPLGAGGTVGGATVNGSAVENSPTEVDLLQRQRTPLLPGRVWSPVRTVQGDHRRPIEVTVVPKDSCLYTGAHHEQLESVPVDGKGRPLVKVHKGECTKCGLERWYRSNYWENRRAYERRKQAEEARRSIDVSRLESVMLQHDDRPDWDRALDALCYAGGGTWSVFERIARHIQASGIFVDQLARSLESLGHIDIRRHEESLRPVAWEIAPSVLAETSRGYFLSGYWPGVKSDNLFNELERKGRGMARTAENPEGPSSWFLDRRPPCPLEGAEVIDDAARKMASVLPRLSEVVAGLPRVPASPVGQIRWFEPNEARWKDTTGLGLKGAYRMSRFSTTDVIRTDDDLERGTMAIGTVQLTKHAAFALLRERPLMAYDKDLRQLSVPLGADLPGLYGRAAVLCSGVLPVKAGRSLVYQDVPADVAEHLAYLMTH